jgi:cyclopropane-fatty-acyl-phospholipid synthase
MQRISKGQLRVLTYSHIYSFPAPGATDDTEEFKAELRVLNDAFWIRLCLMSDLGFAESYMYGDVECDDLVSLFNVINHNFCSRAAAELPARFFSTIGRASRIYLRALRTCSPCLKS